MNLKILYLEIISYKVLLNFNIICTKTNEKALIEVSSPLPCSCSFNSYIIYTITNEKSLSFLTVAL